MIEKTTKAFSLHKGGALIKPRRWSELSESERAEILADAVYLKYRARIEAENWCFARIPGKGWMKK